MKFCFPSSFDHIPQVLIQSVVSLNFSHKLKCIRNPTYFIFPQIKPHSTRSQVVYCSTKVRDRASALHCQPSTWVPDETSIIQSGPQGLTVISPNKMTLRCDTTLRWGCCAHFLWSLSFWTHESVFPSLGRCHFPELCLWGKIQGPCTELQWWWLLHLCLLSFQL